jgi:AcrR family transcriptional regulator
MPARKSNDLDDAAHHESSRSRPAGGSPTRVPQPRKRQASPLRVRKEPRQQRSRQMVEAILQAAAELFADLGYARATTNKIAERAGVSVGSLYQYFPNKDSLLAGLLAQHHADVDRVLDAALDRLADTSVGLEVGIRSLFTELMAVHQDNPALTRALSTAVLGESPARKDDHDDEARSQLLVAVLASRPDVRSGNHAAMAMVLGQAVAHLSRWLVHDVPDAIADPVLEEVVALQVRFLSAEVLAD